MDFGQLTLVCCVIPFLVLAVAGFVVFRNFSRFLRALPEFTAPDTEELHRQYEVMKASYPDATQQQLVRRIINQYAVRQGIVGAVTSVGGFIALPLGLSIDLVYSARSNAALSFFIAQIYGIESEQKTLNIGQLLVLRQRKVSADELVMWQEQFAGVAYQQLAQSILQKSVAKIIPGAGAIIGFIVNYTSAQLFGTVADQYYSGNLNKLVGEGRGRLEEFSSLSPDQRQELWQRFRSQGTSLVDGGVNSLQGAIQKLQEKNYDPTGDRITQLQELVALKEKGVLTEEEFTSMKQAIMGGLAETMEQAEADVQTDGSLSAVDDASPPRLDASDTQASTG